MADLWAAMLYHVISGIVVECDIKGDRREWVIPLPHEAAGSVMVH